MIHTPRSIEPCGSLGSFRGMCLCLFLGVVSVMVPGRGFGDDFPNAPKVEPRKHGPGQVGPFGPGYPMVRTKSIDSGYLFLDGKYVELPFELEYDSSEMKVNGADVTKCFPSAESPQKHSSRSTGNRPWEGRGSFWGGPRSSFRHASEVLESDGVVILRTGEKPILMDEILSSRFLGFLIDEETRQSASVTDLAWVPRASEHNLFMEWLQSYEPSATLRERIEQRIAERDATEEMNASRREAVRRLDQWDYPLTVFGMVLVVAAIGHLLNRRPEPESPEMKINAAPEAIRQTNYSLVLVAAMSGMDLVWTILISQAGAMKELNPLGSHLLKDPLQLVIFKVALTGLAVALIFGLRRYRRAQLASWWGCLLFTIVMVRWLTLNSLFV